MTNNNANPIPDQVFGSFKERSYPGIDRANYIAMQANDPAAAARFAVDHMGFHLVHVDDDRRHYLAAAGLDPYSLVYTPGQNGTVDHISYLVRSTDDLLQAERHFRAQGLSPERVEHSPLWRHAPAIRITNPGGQMIELTTGVNVDIPMGAGTAAPKTAPAPIAFDHAVVRATDLPASYDFASRVLGLWESARIVAPDGVPILGFFRSHTLFHCYAIAASNRNTIHHMQFTLKNPDALHAAYEKLKSDGAHIVLAPVRHGPGHNIAFYFLDQTGVVVEYSVEEEIVLDNANYVPRVWPVTDPKSISEWSIVEMPELMR